MAAFFNLHLSGVPSHRPDVSSKKPSGSSDPGERIELIASIVLSLFFAAFFGFVIWAAANNPARESPEEGDTNSWYMGP